MFCMGVLSMKSSEQKKPQERFTDLVEKYVKYRPSYPDIVLGTIREKFSFSSRHLVADIGSGTGIFTRLLLENGNRVYAVEPNKNMLEASKEYLSCYDDRCTFIERSAEDTGLADHSVDFITVAQAFHWFKADEVIAEFSRVLKESGVVMLVWNNRKKEQTAFTAELDTLLKEYCPEYEKLTYKEVDRELILNRFKGWEADYYTFYNYHDLDLEGLRGRLDSASFCPDKECEGYEVLIEKLKELYYKYEENGKVRMEYDCNLYCFTKRKVKG